MNSEFELKVGNLTDEEIVLFINRARELCDRKFGDNAEVESGRMKDNIARLAMDGKYVALSRLTVRCIGNIIGQIIEIEIFIPQQETTEDTDDDYMMSFLGNLTEFTIDTTDNSFTRTESWAELEIDETGHYFVDIQNCFDDVISDYDDSEPIEDELTTLLTNYSKTPNTDDLTKLNLARQILF